MNTNLKIQQLWRYLRIRDNEVLIVQVYNPQKGVDEYLVTEKHGNELTTACMDEFLEYVKDKPFRLIQQLDEECHHEIPSVTQMEHDRLIDY